MSNSRQPNPSFWVYIAAFLIVVVWGCTFVQTKVLINAGLRPDEIFTLRFVIAYLLMLPFAGRRLFLDMSRMNSQHCCLVSPAVRSISLWRTMRLPMATAPTSRSSFASRRW